MTRIVELEANANRTGGGFYVWMNQTHSSFKHASGKRVDGSYDSAFELCCTACERFGWYNRNTALNPFTVEGK